MIGALTGMVDQINDDHCILDVGGVGYLVFCSTKTLQKLNVREAVKLLVETRVREDAISLYGFLSAEEKNWFTLLTGKVSGVGARMGLAILSALTPHEIFSAIASRDKNTLTKADGVGQKLAERIITELKDKVSSFAIGEQKVAISESKNSQVEDAVSALANLGYKRAAAFETVWAIYNGLNGKKVSTEELIKLGLKELSSS